MRNTAGEETTGSDSRAWDRWGSLLTARETVEYLSISLSTLNRMEKQGLLVPFRTPGGHRRYDKAMLDHYLETTRRGPGRRGQNGGLDGPSSGNGEHAR
jgi:excisionase family DNA binding protein